MKMSTHVVCRWPGSIQLRLTSDIDKLEAGGLPGRHDGSCAEAFSYAGIGIFLD